jgi:hypothetical protein
VKARARAWRAPHFATFIRATCSLAAFVRGDQGFQPPLPYGRVMISRRWHVILRFYPKRVETKKNAGFFLVQAPELPRCREMGNALSPGLGDAELQKFTW